MVTHTLCTARFAMITVTYVPLFVTLLLRGMPGLWKSRPRLSLCWLVFMPALYPGRNTWEALSRWTPAAITAWRFRRLGKASAWPGPLRLEWWVQEARNTLPPSEHGDLHLVGDGSDKPKRGTPHPLAPTGRKRAQHPGFFGMRFALVLVHWDVHRFPGAFRLMRPHSPPASQSEHALCRERVGRLIPPPWAKRMLVEGEAAYGSQDHRQRVMKRDADDPARRWGFVCAMARTWKAVEGQALKDWVTPVPRQYSQRIRVPRLPGTTGCTPGWV